MSLSSKLMGLYIVFQYMQRDMNIFKYMEINVNEDFFFSKHVCMGMHVLISLPEVIFKY